MPREASFWQWYVETNDSLRHDLVERPWYGREVTGDAARDSLVELEQPSDNPAHEGTVWEQENAQDIHSAEMADFYGEPAEELEPSDAMAAPSIEPPEPEID